MVVNVVRQLLDFLVLLAQRVAVQCLVGARLCRRAGRVVSVLIGKSKIVNVELSLRRISDRAADNRQILVEQSAQVTVFGDLAAVDHRSRSLLPDGGLGYSLLVNRLAERLKGELLVHLREYRLRT